MAASSSTSSSAAKQNDVFISFRGEDTRHNFISHLYSALSRNSITAYIDYKLNKGDEISPALVQAIQDSHGSLVVFSENYASSKWCLNELLKILECRKQGHFVIPVFYKIDPSHVRKQIASYGEAFAKHEQNSNNNTDMLQKWKAALTEAANIVGWDSQSWNNRDESELIQNIVEDILQKLDCFSPRSDSRLVGIDKHCEHVESLLQRFPVIGIWGIGGIGKTTIAKATFNKLFSQYDSCYFFENLREESERSGLNQLRAKLLSNLLKDDIIPINLHKPVGLKHAMRRLSSKKVFIVLDDVNSFELLEYLEREFDFLGLGSRVIVTTRNKHLLTSLRVTHEIYEAKGLNLKDSLELFKLNAFNKNFSEVGYEEMTGKFVRYAKGSPLTLKVLGSFLCSKSREEWESAWKKLNKIQNEDIQKVLKLSFDGLDHEEQQIFLDIACFLKGENEKGVISLLDSYGFYGDIGMRTLKDKALITVSYGYVQMHDLIQQMGWQIVHTESIKEPGRRSRIWNLDEVYDVLKYNKGTDAVEGIILNMSKIKHLHLRSDTFKRMTNLRFLKFYYNSYEKSCKVHSHVNIQSFSDKLRYFRWDNYPLLSLPSTFCAEKLVEFHIPDSNIKKLWDGVQDLVNLKSLNLRGCKQLIEIPDFSKASSLKSVDLSSCESLCDIHPSILSLHTLESLKLWFCKKLKSLRSKVHLKSLRDLQTSGCCSLKEFSLSSEKITELIISETAIEILDSSIGRCTNLKTLIIEDPLKNIPSDLSKLTSLTYLEVRHCRELDTLTLHVVLEGLRCLEELDLQGCCNLTRLPDNIKHLSCLRRLFISFCKRLSCIPELPSSIEILGAEDCRSLETITTPTPLECRKSCYILSNCVKLDDHSLSAVIKDVKFKIKRSTLFHDGSCYDHDLVHDLICSGSDSLFFPGNYHLIFPGNKVPIWLKNQTTQNWITIEISPHSYLFGFAFVCILSAEFLPNEGSSFDGIACDCYLEDTPIITFEGGLDRVSSSLEWISDHVWIWYNHTDCHKFFDAMEEHRAKGRSTKRLSFEFFAEVWDNKRDTTIRTGNAIRECGVWPVYASEYGNS